MTKFSTRKPLCGAFGIHKNCWNLAKNYHRENDPWHHVKPPWESSANIENQLSVGTLAKLFFMEKNNNFLRFFFRSWRVWKSTKCWKCHEGKSVAGKDSCKKILIREDSLFAKKKLVEKKDYFGYSFLCPQKSKFWLSIGHHGRIKWTVEKTKKYFDREKD